MLKIERFINELMTSNCYVVYDKDTKHCLVIDPGSKESLREIEFIEKNNLCLDFIIITHEHTDHNWGVNALREHFENCKLLCSEECGKHVKKANRAYFLLYYDDPNYRYEIAPADKFVNDGERIEWSGHLIKFVSTPGHSYGSVCIDIDGNLFTGDTIMLYKPYINKRNGSQDKFIESVGMVLRTFPKETLIFPGHGEPFLLKDYQR